MKVTEQSATLDNDYIRTCITRRLHDPFLIGSQRKVDVAILNAELLRIPPDKWEKHLTLQSDKGAEKLNFVPPVEREPTAIGGTRTEMKTASKIIIIHCVNMARKVNSGGPAISVHDLSTAHRIPWSDFITLDINTRQGSLAPPPWKRALSQPLGALPCEL